MFQIWCFELFTDYSFMHILIWLLFTLIRLTTSFIKIKSNKIPSFCLFWGGLNAPLWQNPWPQLGPLSKIGLEPPLQVRLNIAIQPVSKNLTDLRILSVRLAEHSGVNNPVSGWLQRMFGKWKDLVMTLLLSVGIFVAILICSGCCCIPCLRSLINWLIMTALSTEEAPPPYQMPQCVREIDTMIWDDRLIFGFNVVQASTELPGCSTSPLENTRYRLGPTW